MASGDITISLYNGAHTVVYKDKSHRYYVDGKSKQGVTSKIGKVIAKSGLMLWPLNEALKYLETKLPLITKEDLEESRKAHVKKRDKGADTGSTVHELVEGYLRGNKLVLDNQPEEVQKATTAFKNWFEGAQAEVLAVEQLVFSESRDYAGTFDSILRVNDKTYLCDLKTTNASLSAPEGIYAENFLQLGAYLLAYNEQREYELANGGTELHVIDDVMIISCKKTGKLDIKTGNGLGLSTDKCQELWNCVLSLCDFLAITTKKLGGR